MNKFRVGAVIAGIIIIIGLILTPFFIERINPGHVGVVYKPGSGVQEETLGQGWHPVAPFDRITEYPIRLQTVSYKDMTLATKDGKNVTLDFSYNYLVQPDKVVPIYNKFGPIKVSEIEEGYLRTRLFDAARKVVSKYTVLELYGEKSAEVSAGIKAEFAEDVVALGFSIDDLTLGAPKPDEKTQEAIDARVNAAQELDRKKTELEIAIAEAERKREEAKGNADAKVIEAKGNADANELLQQSITPQLIQYEIAKKWNGQVPLVEGGGAGQIISVPLPSAEGK